MWRPFASEFGLAASIRDRHNSVVTLGEKKHDNRADNPRKAPLRVQSQGPPAQGTALHESVGQQVHSVVLIIQ